MDADVIALEGTDQRLGHAIELRTANCELLTGVVRGTSPMLRGKGVGIAGDVAADVSSPTPCYMPLGLTVAAVEREMARTFSPL